jgi:ATP-binding cassette subfamily C (CFTR/MRP) protein 2
MAYVAQSAWIQSGKVEDNIRFGARMNRAHYDAVLEACALNKDLQLLAFGDQTEIGERGLNLSGGQKQRIQLARALYQDSDIYLLDDPFSAVDAHTGSHLFRECILGMLASKTVVYVTHQMEFLPVADLILVLDKGVIVQAGKYDELLQAGTNFNTLVNAHNEALDQHTEAATEASFLHNPEIDLLEAVTGVEASSDGDVMRNHHHHQNGVDKMDKQLQKQISNKTTLTQMGLQKQSSKKENDSGRDAMRRQLIEEEEREKGDVNFNVYWSYITSVDGGTYMMLAMLCQTCFIVCFFFSLFFFPVLLIFLQICIIYNPFFVHMCKWDFCFGWSSDIANWK